MKSVEKKHRRFLAAILALCLLLGLCPFTPPAQAEETTTTTVAGSTTIEDAQSVPIGESVTTTLVAGKNYYAIPDVKATDKFAAEIYEFYRAGILTGSDAKGTFHSASTIKRSEAAAILLRMFEASARVSIDLP